MVLKLIYDELTGRITGYRNEETGVVKVHCGVKGFLTFQELMREYNL